MKIAESDLVGIDRTKRWPAVFGTKTVKSSYTHKGRAAKMKSALTGKWHYTLVFGNVECYGAEGTQEGFLAESKQSKHPPQQIKADKLELKTKNLITAERMNS